MNSSEYLSKKKNNISTSRNILNNNSVVRLAKSLYNDDGSNCITVNTNIANSNLKYLYSVNSIKPGIYTNANDFPLLIYNKGCSGLDVIANDYSISRINYFLDYLKNDNYDKVFSELTSDETQKILYGLNILKTKSPQCFVSLIELYENMFKSIKYFYFLYGEMTNNETSCLKYKQDSEILNDMEKLKEYIKEQQLYMNTVTNVSIQVSKLDIKPEYKTYIETYGIPYKMIFDPFLLQQIIDNM